MSADHDNDVRLSGPGPGASIGGAPGSIRMLPREAAAEYIRSMGLPCTGGTLAKHAVHGSGPRFHKFGRACVYSPADLDEWVRARLSSHRYRSTSEYNAA